MARIRILIVLAVALCAIAVAPSPAAASPESYMMRKINHYRHRHGLRGVHLRHNLKHSAGRYARWMMRHHYFGHRARIHASRHYHRLGEILEVQRGSRPHVKWAFSAWIHSPEHRSIILDRHFSCAGAGRAVGRYGGHMSTMWVMHFGHP